MKDLIVSILDRSGSMGIIAEEAIAGYNTFIEDQRQLGDADVSLYIFDDHYDVVYENKSIADVPALTDKTFVPRGMTALLDAIGKTIVSVGEQLNALPDSDKPNKVLVCILTDGAENASKEYTKARIHEMIEHQRNVYSWEFIFLAANVDAFAVGNDLGIAKAFTQSFQSTHEGTQVAYDSMSRMAASYRVGT